MEQNEAPKDAKPGELYIVGTKPSDEFANHIGEIAQKLEQGWRFIPPLKWMRVTLDGDGSLHCFNGKRWQPALQDSQQLRQIAKSEITPKTNPAITTTATSSEQIQNDYLIKGEDGEYLRVIHLQEELEVKGAFTETKIKIPHHSIVLAVNIRVLKQIQGASAFSVGTGEDKGRYGSGLSSSQDSTNIGLTNHPLTYWHDTSVRITAEGSSFTDGLVKVTVQLLKPHGPWKWG